MIPFRYVAGSVFLFFMILMLVVAVIAFTKKYSGVTGIDMSQIQHERIKNSG